MATHEQEYIMLGSNIITLATSDCVSRSRLLGLNYNPQY